MMSFCNRKSHAKCAEVKRQGSQRNCIANFPLCGLSVTLSALCVNSFAFCSCSSWGLNKWFLFASQRIISLGLFLTTLGNLGTLAHSRHLEIDVLIIFQHKDHA